MTIAAYLTLAIILSALFLLILTRIPAPAIFFGALAAAMTLKLAPVEELLKGFSNRGTLTTNIITNNAAAAFMYPIAFATARQLDISFLPFAIVLMMAASCAFIVPRGYQTNTDGLGRRRLSRYRFHQTRTCHHPYPGADDAGDHTAGFSLLNAPVA